MPDIASILIAAITGNAVAFLMHRRENMRQTKVLEEIRDRLIFKG